MADATVADAGEDLAARHQSAVERGGVRTGDRSDGAMAHRIGERRARGDHAHYHDQQQKGSQSHCGLVLLARRR
jgi:hypothetical protein